MLAQKDSTLEKNELEPDLTIALLLWGDDFEDFLDSIGVSLEKFCSDALVGWVLGYIDSLRLVRVRTVVILVSSRINFPLYFQHVSTGSTISVLPASRCYRFIRQWMIYAYPSLRNNVKDLFGDVRGLQYFVFKILHLITPYVATPIRSLINELRRERCKAILCQEYEYSRFDICVFLGKILKLPVFGVFQGGSSDWNVLGRLLRPFTIKNSAGLIIGSQDEIDRVQQHYGVSRDKIANIFNPININEWLAIDKYEARKKFDIPIDTQVVVWHGRVDIYRKGLDILLEAWCRVCNERIDKNLCLFLLGSGTDAERFGRLISALPVRNVNWIDQYLTDRAVLRSFLSVGDIYAFPSRHEGFAVAPIEAMACSLPIVATDALGVPELLAEGEDSGGLLVPREDIVAFASALGRLLDDRAFAQKLAERARCRVEEGLSLEVVGKKLRNFVFSEY